MSLVRLTMVVVWLAAPALASAADSTVAVYLQPLPTEAAKLTFAISAVSAIAAGGAEYRLDVNLRTVGQASASRQRLLASGRLPIGSYTRFTIKIATATVKSEQGQVKLPVPEVPVAVDVPFVHSAQRASLLWVVFKYDGSISNGFSFTPVFMGLAPPRPIASRAGFVTNSASNTLTVFDKTAGQAVAVIDTCVGASGLALDQRRRQLYVACARDDEIQAIDVAASEVVERARVSPGDAPREAALTPDGKTLVSVNSGSNSVTFFDTAPLTRLERVAVGAGPGSILIDPTGTRAFVFNTLASSISVLDVARRTVVATIATDSAPLRGQFNARADKLFVIHERSPYVTVFDPVRLTTLTRGRVRSGISCIKSDARRNLLYIGGTDDQMVEFYSPDALLPVDAMKTSGGASYLTIDTEEDRLYMVSPDTRSLVIGSLASRKVVAEIDVGEKPYWVAVMGEK